MSDNGTTTVQNGTLTIVGTLSDNGTIIGDTWGDFRDVGLPRAAGDGLAVLGDYVAGAGATLHMLSSDLAVKVGGDFDVAINDPARLDLTAARLQLIGLPGDDPQAVEVMAANLGREVSLPDPSVYSVRKPRIGPTETSVVLVDNHDNSGSGAEEVLYVKELVLEPGVEFDLAGQQIHYETVVPADPTDPDSGVTVIDSAGGGGLVAMVPPFYGDFNGDGHVSLDDCQVFPECIAGPGVTPSRTPPLTQQDCLDSFDFEPDGDVDLGDFAAFQEAFTGSTP